MSTSKAKVVSTVAQHGALRVFVSSRMQELRDARAVVEESLKDIYVEAYVYEKVQGADPKTVVDTSLSEVDRSDIVVVLFSQSYGQITVEEFRHARKLMKPCLVYLEGRHKQRDHDLETFLGNEIYDPERGVTYAYFEDVVTLGKMVGRDILRLLVEAHRRGGRQLPLSALPPVAKLAWDVADWYQVLDGCALVEDPSLVDEKTMDLKIRLNLSIPGLGPVRQEVKIRCAHGRVTQSHVKSFYHDLIASGAEKGEIIADLEITPEARKEAHKVQRIVAHTLDELLDKTVRFDSYLDYLEGTIKANHVDTLYLTLGCTWQEADGGDTESPAENHYTAEEGGIDSYVKLWLLDSRKEHVSILGEFGTGKTWTVLHIAWECLQEYRKAKHTHIPRPRLPLLVSLRDVAKTVSLESLISDFFFVRHNIGISSLKAFTQLNRMGKFLLLFDGFDEMASRVDKQTMVEKFWELARVLMPGAKAVLTCRTEHFQDAKEARLLLSSELQASTAGLSGESPQFEVVELHKFDQRQIETVLSRMARPETVKRIVDNPDLMDLASRPLMADLIVKALPEVEAGAPVDMSRIYLYAIRSILLKDITDRRSFVSLANKFFFLCELSWEMLSTDKMSLNSRGFPDVVRRLFGQIVGEEKDLDHWCHDLMAQSMLTPNADGDFSFAHRSILEFFVAYKFVAEMGVLAEDFTDLAREIEPSYIDKEADPSCYTWYGYFTYDRGPTGEVKKKSPLKSFVMEHFDEYNVVALTWDDTAVRAFPTENIEETTRRRGVVGMEKLPRNTFALAAGMVSDDAEDLDRLCQMAFRESGVVAWHAISLLPYLKTRRPERLATMLVAKGYGRPLRRGVPWVLGELGVYSEEVVKSLTKTVQAFAEGCGGIPAAWWESAFALEKLGYFGDLNKGRNGDQAIDFLIKHLPPGYSLAQSTAHLQQVFKAKEAEEATINHCDIVAIVQHESQLVASTLFEELLSLVDFSADMLGRRCYYAVWLCGHLRIKESLDGILKATRHRQSSVRNCACEALGKIGIADASVTAALERALGDGYYRTRFHAAWALGAIRSVASIPILNGAIKIEQVRDVRQEMTRVRDFLKSQVLAR
jgi:hypothetical protein